MLLQLRLKDVHLQEPLYHSNSDANWSEKGPVEEREGNGTQLPTNTTFYTHGSHSEPPSSFLTWLREVTPLA